MSKNKRYAVNFAYYAGLVAIPIIFGFVLHVRLSIYVETAVASIYVFGASEIISRVLGGSSSEQAFGFPYPLDQIFNTVPKVFEKNRWTLYGKIVEADSTSNRYVVKQGWGRWAGAMTINLSKIDENSTQVNVLCERNYFFDWGTNRRIIDVFLRELHLSLTTTN